MKTFRLIPTLALASIHVFGRTIRRGDDPLTMGDRDAKKYLDYTRNGNPVFEECEMVDATVTTATKQAVEPTGGAQTDAEDLNTNVNAEAKKAAAQDANEDLEQI